MQALNNLPHEEFTEIFTNIVDNFPEIATDLAAGRPYTSPGCVLTKMKTTMENLNVDKKVEILAKFPDLVARVTCTNSPLSKASIGERQSAGLYSLTPEERKYLTNLGNNYRDKFGFTFVICARQNKIQSILSGLENRMENTTTDEIENGTQEVIKIASLRALDIINVFQPNI